jgi:DNA topoisomerase-1
MNSYISRLIREKNSKEYEYFTIDNKKIKDTIILNKISKIYIPPAYQNVKIYLNKNLLATGIDSVGRKQYIYSDNMKRKREIKKIKQLRKLSENINNLTKKINKDLLNKDFKKDKLIALVLKIMDLCNFRGGNKEYEKRYGSYGLTTLHKEHIKIKKKYIEINFTGKKGVNNNCIINNKIIQNIIKDIYKISSKKDSYIFSIIYKGDNISINMVDINKYLESFNITCKDLRTWNANIIFLKNIKNQIIKIDNYDNPKIIKKIIRESINKTAISLHNTPAVCKNSYILKNLIVNIETKNNILKKLINNNNIENVLKKFISRN